MMLKALVISALVALSLQDQNGTFNYSISPPAPYDGLPNFIISFSYGLRQGMFKKVTAGVIVEWNGYSTFTKNDDWKTPVSTDKCGTGTPTSTVLKAIINQTGCMLVQLTCDATAGGKNVNLATIDTTTAVTATCPATPTAAGIYGWWSAYVAPLTTNQILN